MLMCPVRYPLDLIRVQIFLETVDSEPRKLAHWCAPHIYTLHIRFYMSRG